MDMSFIEGAEECYDKNQKTFKCWCVKCNEYTEWYYSNQVCKECQVKHQRKYYECNKKRIREHQRGYYECNKERLNEKQREYGRKNKKRIDEYKKEHYKCNKERINEKRKERYKNNKHYDINDDVKIRKWAMSRLSTLKSRAKNKNLEFNLELQDILDARVKYCPYLGYELMYGSYNEERMLSASVDRIDTTKGYIKGNIEIISNRANIIKSNLTYDQWIVFAKRILNVMEAA